MKCKHCGNNLRIEDAFCPYCGEPNEFAKKHREEMKKFEQDYEETKKEVLENTGKLNKKTVRITVIAVLIALVALMAFLNSKAWDIRYSMRQKNIELNASKITANVEEYMEERDYVGLFNYMYQNDSTYSDVLDDYLTVYQESHYYTNFLRDLTDLVEKTNKTDTWRYYSLDDMVSEVSANVFRVYDGSKPLEYSPERTSGNKGEYISDMIYEMDSLIMGYFQMSREEVEAMHSMTQSRIDVTLEDAYAKTLGFESIVDADEAYPEDEEE